MAEDLATGQFVAAAGGAGGSRIISATIQNIHYHLDQGLTAEATVRHSRWHDQLTNVTFFEVNYLLISVPMRDSLDMAVL
jgi:gamma-glutamyltranspeptidase / glutathione hydrolase